MPESWEEYAVPAYKKPIRRSLLKIGLIFIAMLILLNIAQSAGMLRLALQRRYDAHLRDVIAHVEGELDMEDLEECIRTKVPSEKFDALQKEVNLMVDDFELIYLYICIPVDDGQGTMIYVVASTSEAERAAGDSEDWPLMYTDSGYFTGEQMEAYLDAWNKSPEMTTFENDSAFGPCYTMCKPLLSKSGETLALLGADISTGEMRQRISSYIWISIGLILLISFLFALNATLWLRKAVTEPLGTLEERARGFVERIHGKKDPGLLVFETPQFRSNNEIQWLADAIGQMSEDMRDYVEGTLAAEKRVESAKEEVKVMTHTAYEDTLTKVKSKVAFDAKKAELTKSIADGNAEFAMVMVDLNNLKRINDNFGLERGSKYIISGSKLISEVYPDSPVYRIGGDEFVAVLENEAYKNRDELFDLLEEKFRDAQSDMSREIWERCSAAAGMAEYSAEGDSDVDQVYRRAEKIMIRNKRMMKNELI